MAKARSYQADAGKSHPLPPSLPPRGLSRVEAASYVGVSTTLFDAMVKDRRMPRPKRVNARTIWDRISLDQAFFALPEDGGEAETQKDRWSEFEV